MKNRFYLFLVVPVFFWQSACETAQVKDRETLQKAKEEAAEGSDESWQAIERALATSPPQEQPDLHNLIIDEAGDIDRPEAIELLKNEATSEDLVKRELALKNLEEQQKFGHHQEAENAIVEAIASNREQYGVVTKPEIERLGMIDSDLGRDTLIAVLGKDPELDPLVMSAIAGQHSDLNQKIAALAKEIEEKPAEKSKPPTEQSPAERNSDTQEPDEKTTGDTLPPENTKVNPESEKEEQVKEENAASEEASAKKSKTPKEKKKNKKKSKTETSDTLAIQPIPDGAENQENVAAPESDEKSKTEKEETGATKAETIERLKDQQKRMVDALIRYAYSNASEQNRLAALNILHDSIYAENPDQEIFLLNRTSPASNAAKLFIYQYLAEKSPSFAKATVNNLRAKYLNEPSYRNSSTLFEIASLSGSTPEEIRKELDKILKERDEAKRLKQIAGLSPQEAILKVLSPYGLTRKTLEKMDAHYRSVIADDSVPQKPEARVAYAALKSIYVDKSFFEIKEAGKRGFDNRKLFTSAMDIVLYDYTRDDIRILVMQDLFGLTETEARKLLHGYRRERWVLKKANF